jgi:anti-anti-sigma factor
MLRIESERPDATVILRVAGPLQAGEPAAVLREQARRWLARGARVLALDLSAVLAMDAGGIGALLDIRRAAETAGGEVVLLRPARRVRHLLAISGLIGRFKVCEREVPVVERRWSTDSSAPWEPVLQA